ncbi:MAG: sigma-E processing peptidase SpoIIGA [Oscillospiraceae bacterium]|nr:sigma-E processing peptidase SpoIIGA [Oscillospiraceae bacterium]
MTVYLDGVIFLNFLVDFLLLLAAGRLCGFPVRIGRAAAGGALGGVYAAFCLLPGFSFLGNFLWRTVSLCAIAVVAYGFSLSGLRRGLVFVFLCLALGGAVTGIGKGGILGIVCAAGIICLLCCVGFHGRLGGTNYLPVELSYGGRNLRLTALQDTGNTLLDPVTGQQVLVIGADAAQKLTGLTLQQLQSPVESVGAIPGLRLIPYHCVGGCGFMLALRLQGVKIGSWQGSTLVAFAPEGLNREGAYQALTGGAL